MTSSQPSRLTQQGCTGSASLASKTVSSRADESMTGGVSDLSTPTLLSGVVPREDAPADALRVDFIGLVWPGPV